MEAAGRIVGRTLIAVREAARPGVTTADLDAVAEEVIRSAGAVPSFLGYEGFPASVCASVNEVVVHGIPSAETVLAEGDVVSIDCGAILDGWHGDSAWTFGVGELSAPDATLVTATREVLEQGMLAMRPGARLTDVSHALEVATREAESRHGVSLGIVDGYGGHGIGRSMHEPPFLANEGRAGRGPAAPAPSPARRRIPSAYRAFRAGPAARRVPRPLGLIRAEAATSTMGPARATGGPAPSRPV